MSTVQNSRSIGMVYGGIVHAHTVRHVNATRAFPLGPRIYKPFGTGPRACIGRQFALHKAMLALAAVLHQFDVQADPGYDLRISEALTLQAGVLTFNANSGFTFSAEPLFEPL
jgi:hypothetical protein